MRKLGNLGYIKTTETRLTCSMHNMPVSQSCLSFCFLLLKFSFNLLLGNAICEERTSCNECITNFDGPLCGWCVDQVSNIFNYGILYGNIVKLNYIYMCTE